MTTVKRKGFTIVEAIVVAAILGTFLVSLPQAIGNMFGHKYEMLQSERADILAQELIWETYYRVTQSLNVKKVSRSKTINRFDQKWKMRYTTKKTYIRGIYKHQFLIYNEDSKLQSEMSIFLKGL